MPSRISRNVGKADISVALMAFIAMLIATLTSPAGAQSIQWIQRAVVPPSSDGPLVFDSARGVCVTFGGDSEIGHPTSETLEWNGDAWTNRHVSGPTNRYGPAMAFDTERHVTVLFGGGTDAAMTDETWEWSGSAWAQKQVAGPSPRYGHAMAYDAEHHVTVLFGGATTVVADPSIPALSGETWVWDGDTWTHKQVAGPSPRAGHAMTYDAERKVTILFGGFSSTIDGTLVLDDDTWEWNGDTWTRREVPHPSPRAGHAMTYDATSGITLLFGGVTGFTPNGDGIPNGDTWEWNGSAWTKRPTVDGPPPLAWHAMAFDTRRNVAVLHGGTLQTLDGSDRDNWTTWEWNGAAWTSRHTVPPPSVAHAMAYDSGHNRTLLFGGIDHVANDGGFVSNAETWEWSGASWMRHDVTGPSPRGGHKLAYDSARAVTILFGGNTGVFHEGQNDRVYSGETWEWNASAWTLRSTSGPSPRQSFAMAYDAARQVTVLFGGSIPSHSDRETWEWNGNAWTLRATSGPSARAYHAMAYDSARHVCVLFGGDTDVSGPSGETWEWNGNTWTLRSTEGPSPREGHAMAYDPVHGVTILFGGFNAATGYLGETWEWNGAAWTQRNGVEPSPRAHFAMVYDTYAQSALLFGGWDGANARGDTWQLAAVCTADFDSDGFLTFEDFDAFVSAFEAGDSRADFDADGFLTFEDFDAFVTAFEAGC